MNYEGLTFPSRCVLLWKSAHSTPQIICRSHRFVKHIIYLAGFQVVKSHRATTLGSHYSPFMGYRAQHANEPKPFTSAGEPGWEHPRWRRDTGAGTSAVHAMPLRIMPSWAIISIHPKKDLNKTQWCLGFDSKYLEEEKDEQQPVSCEAGCWAPGRTLHLSLHFSACLKTSPI